MLTLRYMHLTDIQQVVAIDRLSFDPPWSPRSYAYEVSESTYSHMAVLAQHENTLRTSTNATSHTNGSNSGDKTAYPLLRRLIQTLNGTSVNVGSEPRVLGYGGLWNIVDEAHISTIATHPDYRGRGWGEVLLAAMIRKSMMLQAAYIVLEVRVSNKAAQNLYHKYEFIIAGVKTRYYQNNGEDAFDMRLDLLRDGYQAAFEQRYADLLARHEFIDQYTQTPHPHAQR